MALLGITAARRVHNKSYIQYDHENDTEDIPDGMDPILAQRGSAGARMQHQKEMDNFVKSLSQMPPVDDDSFVQFVHENDTDDIAET